jgi:hypothetical protein
LQFAANVSKPNGGNFANSLASGLLAGSNQVNDAQGQYGNDRYRDDIMQRTQAEMAANTQLGQSQIMGPDGKIDEAKFQQYAVQDPSGAKALRDAIQPDEKWTPANVSYQGAQGTVLSDGRGHLRTLDGQPFLAPQDAPQGAPAPTTGGAPGLLSGALAAGGQPFYTDVEQAIAPYGAKVTSTTGGQHNVGSLHASGRAMDIGMGASATDAIRAQAPQLIADLQNRGYTVRDERTHPAGQAVWGGPHIHVEVPQGGGAMQPPAAAPALPFGFSKKEAAAAAEPKLGQDYRWADAAHTKAEPIPGSAADQGASGLDADSVKNLAYDQIFTGHRPPAGRNGGSAVFKAVENEVARVAKEAGVSPMALAT